MRIRSHSGEGITGSTEDSEFVVLFDGYSTRHLVKAPEQLAQLCIIARNLFPELVGHELAFTTSALPISRSEPVVLDQDSWAAAMSLIDVITVKVYSPSAEPPDMTRLKSVTKARPAADGSVHGEEPVTETEPPVAGPSKPRDEARSTKSAAPSSSKSRRPKRVVPENEDEDMLPADDPMDEREEEVESNSQAQVKRELERDGDDSDKENEPGDASDKENFSIPRRQEPPAYEEISHDIRRPKSTKPTQLPSPSDAESEGEALRPPRPEPSPSPVQSKRKRTEAENSRHQLHNDTDDIPLRDSKRHAGASRGESSKPGRNASRSDSEQRAPSPKVRPEPERPVRVKVEKGLKGSREASRAESPHVGTPSDKFILLVQFGQHRKTFRVRGTYSVWKVLNEACTAFGLPKPSISAIDLVLCFDDSEQGLIICDNADTLSQAGAVNNTVLYLENYGEYEAGE